MLAVNYLTDKHSSLSGFGTGCKKDKTLSTTQAELSLKIEHEQEKSITNL